VNGGAFVPKQLSLSCDPTPHWLAGALSNGGVSSLLFGEEYPSLRPLLKRYQCWLTGVSGVGTAPVAATAQEASGVPIRQYPVSWLGEGPTLVGLNQYVEPNYTGFLLRCFSGVRGSMRHRIFVSNSSFVDGEAGTTIPTTLFVCSPAWGNGVTNTTTLNATYFQSPNTAMGASNTNFLSPVRNAMDGLAFPAIVNPDRVDVEVPYKGSTYYTFAVATTTNAYAAGPVAGYLFQKTNSAACVFGYAQLSAIGEDFMPILYLGPPQVAFSAQTPFAGWSAQV